MQSTPTAPREGRAMTERRIQLAYGGAVEVVYTEGLPTVAILSEGIASRRATLTDDSKKRARVRAADPVSNALDLLPEEAAAFAKNLMRAAKLSGYREPAKVDVAHHLARRA